MKLSSLVKEIQIAKPPKVYRALLSSEVDIEELTPDFWEDWGVYIIEKDMLERHIAYNDGGTSEEQSKILLNYMIQYKIDIVVLDKEYDD